MNKNPKALYPTKYGWMYSDGIERETDSEA